MQQGDGGPAPSAGLAALKRQRRWSGAPRHVFGLWSTVVVTAVVAVALVVYAGIPAMRVALPGSVQVANQPVTAAGGFGPATVEVVPPQRTVDVYDDSPTGPGVAPGRAGSTTTRTDVPSSDSATVEEPPASSGAATPAGSGPASGSNPSPTTTTEPDDGSSGWTPSPTTTPSGQTGTGPAPTSVGE